LKPDEYRGCLVETRILNWSQIPLHVTAIM